MESEVTWRDVAVRYPIEIQSYIQKEGPLPDGPVTPEDWLSFVNFVRGENYGS